MSLKKFKRLLASVLAASMIIGVVPANVMSVEAKPGKADKQNVEQTVETLAVDAESKEVVDAAIIFTDLHTNNGNYKESVINDIFTVLKNTGLPFSSVTSGGDAFSVNEDGSKDNGPYNGYTETISTSIRNALGNANIPVNYVWSDHDRYAYQENDTDTTDDDKTLLDKTSHVVYGAGEDGILGTKDDGNYYVYALSMGDLCSYDRYAAGFSSNRQANGFTATVDLAIENFKADADKMKKDKPLLIVSHQPLLDNRNDNAFAEQWFNAINEVADDMDVAFFFGHNHKYDTKDDYYYAKGSTLPVATKNGWSSFEVGVGYKPSCDLQPANKTSINFTHMCGGYLNPSTTGSVDNSTTRQNTAVAVTIYKDSIQFKTYGTGTNSDKYPLDVTIERKKATVEEQEGAIPQDAVLTKVEIKTEPELKKYFQTQNSSTELPIDLTGLEVSAVYESATKGTIEKELSWNEFKEVDGYSISVDMTKVGKQNVVLTYTYKEVTLSDSFEIEIFEDTNREQVDENTGVSIELTVPGVTNISVEDNSDNEVVAEALKGLVKSYKSYDISLEGYVQGEKVTVTLPIPEGIENPAVYYINESKGRAERLECTVSEDGTKVSFETDHFSTYVIAGTDNMSQVAEVKGYEISTKEEVTVYKLVNNPSAGKSYMIVNSNNANGNNKYALKGEKAAEAVTVKSGGITDATDKKIDEVYIENTNDSAVWIVSNNYQFTNKKDKNIKLGANNNALKFDTARTWSYNNNKLKADNNKLLTLGTNNQWSVGNQGTKVYFYEETTAYKAVETIKADAIYGVSLQIDGNLVENNGRGVYDKKYVVAGTTSQLAAGFTTTVNGQQPLNGEWSWGTSNPQIATVSDNGLVTYTGEDDPVVLQAKYVWTENGSTYTIFNSVTVNVTGPEYSIDIKQGNESVTKPIIIENVTDSTRLQLSAEVSYHSSETTTEQIKNPVILWSTQNNNGLAEITQNGLVSFTGEEGQFYVAAIWDGDGMSHTQVIEIVTCKGKYVAPDTNEEAYPVYPNEGAVKVDKTATGIDFQASGIAKVELSASGIPYENGIDIIVMLDMSSSMNRHTDCGSSSCTDKTCSKIARLAELKEALLTLEKDLKDSKASENMRIAIADFNGFFGASATESNSPYDRRAEDRMEDGQGILSSSGSSNRVGIVYDPVTGQKSSISASAFKPVKDMVNGEDKGLNMEKVNAALEANGATKGTNYDHAFDVIYQLGYAIKEANEEERDLYVIFMSDGAPNQFNYFHSIGGSSLTDTNSSEHWNWWLQGKMEEKGGTSLLYDNADTRKNYEYYYDTKDYDGDGVINEHRMANAIKGNPDDKFTVIRKSTAGMTDLLNGQTGEHNLYTLPGLGATMYSVGFYLKNDGRITVDSVTHVLNHIASDSDKYIQAENQEELEAAFSHIAGDIAYAATNARFVDKMGANYDLQLSKVNYAPMGSNNKTEYIIPMIEVKSYDVYTKADAEAGRIPEGKQIGDRKGTYTLNEVVMFSDDGEKAYSSVIDVNGDGQYGVIKDDKGNYVINTAVKDGKDDNIFDTDDGVIYAKYFAYNTTGNSVTIKKSNVTIEGESFYWNIGTIGTRELALSYYVYLTDSMDPEKGKEAGSYPTNEYATLYYDNYQGVACKKETVSPVLAWKSAAVNYAFYLVDEAGNPVNLDGEIVPFADRVVIVDPTLYGEVLLNVAENEEIDPLQVIASGVIPNGYDLYDAGAQYQVVINSNATGSWVITQTKDPATTYVTGFSSTIPYSAELTTNSTTYAYTDTTVWFALKWEPLAKNDVVVIDYGLPVDVHVMSNDIFGSYGRLVGVAKDVVASTNNNTLISATTVPGEYGQADVIVPTTGANESNSVIRYTPINMQMKGKDVFTYCVEYNNPNYTQNNGYHYGTLTVIPATTIYYEDSFVEYSSYTWDYATKKWAAHPTSVWESVEDSTYVEGAVITQDEDRPGEEKLAFVTTNIDANNIYGYDSAYTACANYSLGRAMKAHVDYDNYGTATFEFIGTGFDVVSVTSSKTGGIIVSVVDANGKEVRKTTVDTYYGMLADGSLELNNPSALYQVPVMEIEGLTYGKYTVTIKAMYSTLYDHSQYPENTVGGKGAYDFYLDAIRIYDPANDGNSESDNIIKDAYAADHEAWPVYEEVRNNVIKAGELSEGGNVSGVVFVDSANGISSVEDYTSYGPNNELYLAKGQFIMFKLDLESNKNIVDKVHIGLKSADGNTVTYKIYAGTDADNKESIPSKTITTSTGMYYDITSLKDGVIVIENTGVVDENTLEANILSITDIKITFTEEPSVAETLFYVSSETIQKVLEAINTVKPEETPDDGTDKPEGGTEQPGETPDDETEQPENEMFKPEQFDVKIDKIKAGKEFKVKITTKDDVEAISVNGTIITSYRYDKKKDEYVWEVKMKAPTDASQISIAIFAYDAEGNMSETQLNVENVEAAKPGAKVKK